MRLRIITPMPVIVAASAMGLNGMAFDYSFLLIKVRFDLPLRCSEVARSR
jgi:hypothetical protein